MVYSPENTPPDTVIARNEVTRQTIAACHSEAKPKNLDPYDPILRVAQDDSEVVAQDDKREKNDWEDRYTPILKMAKELLNPRLREIDGRSSSERRKQSAENIRQHKPWERSTGPKTQDGKAVSSKNAYKHGFRSGDYREILKLLRLQAFFVRNVAADAHEKLGVFNEIRAKKAAMSVTLHQKTKELQDFFAAHGRADIPAREVKAMVKAATGYGEDIYITAPETPLTSQQIGKIDEIVARRAAGEPLYRILGQREFWGLDFKVTSDVLDPRPDTETLVEAALKWARQRHNVIARSESDEAIQNKESKSENGLPRSLQSLAMMQKPLKILDLGTGTGCIPIALLTELPQAQAVAVDISPAAVAVARENAAKNHVADRLEIIEGDLFDAVTGQEFDLILSNPPYIPESHIQDLSAEVKNHDPILALSGGEDGLDFYKKIIFGLEKHLFSHGRAFLEIGFDQLESVSRLVDESNLTLCDSHADISGIPRVVGISRGDK